MIVNRYGGLMPMLDGPNDVFGAEGRVATEENTGPRGL
jgi:hypothetical protein